MPTSLAGDARVHSLAAPASLLGRLRWFFLLFNLFFLVTFLPQVTLQSGRPVPLRALAAAALLALGWWYLRCYRRARFPAYGLLLEAVAFVLAVLLPDDPFKALGLLYISVNFRALYGTGRQAAGFTALALACFAGAVAVVPLLGGPDRLGALLQTVPGVPVLAAITHLVAVACERGERAAARERVLSSSGLAIALAQDCDEVRREALAAVRALTAGLPQVSAEVVVGVSAAVPPSAAGARLVLPLRTRDLQLGVLEVDSPGDLPLEVRDALEALAAQLALGLANAALTADLRHRATHDSLTGLADRSLLEEGLRAALQAPGGSAAAVLLLDLDGFKAVNDTCGHGAGDALLVAVAERLRGAAGAGDLVARLGGDEFAVLLARATAADAAACAQRVETAVSEPVLLRDGRCVRVGASVGVALAQTGRSTDEVLQSADAAMYAAKRRRTGRCVQPVAVAG